MHTIPEMGLTELHRRTVAGLLDPCGGRRFPSELSRDLARRLEEGIRPFLPIPGLAGPLSLSKGRLDERDRCEGLFQAELGGEGPSFEYGPGSGVGTLAHRAIELDVAATQTVQTEHLIGVATERLRGDRQFGPYWEGLDQVGRDLIASRAAASVEQFRASLPPVAEFRRNLAPRTELWLDQPLAGGRVRLRGKVDLVLNPVRANTSTRVLIDFKTGLPWPEHPEGMRLYALLFTLRVGLPPLRVATFFLSSGEWQAEDVEIPALERAVDRVIHSVEAAARWGAGLPPARLTPGAHCGRCPRRMVCPALGNAGEGVATGR